MALSTNRRRFLAGIAAIAITPVIHTPKAWAWSPNAAAILDAAIDDLPDIEETRDEWWARRLHGGWENSRDVIDFRATGKLPWAH